MVTLKIPQGSFNNKNHGESQSFTEEKIIISKTPCSSVYSVVKFFFLSNFELLNIRTKDFSDCVFEIYRQGGFDHLGEGGR
jgi:hypothetical protein